MTLLNTAKRFGLTVAAAIGSPALGRRLLRGRAVIFMLHRFANSECGVSGHSPERLRRSLEYLRRRRFELVSLESLLRGLAAPSGSGGGAVAFTIDDGYLDQATVGAPIFAEFDCPVTTFVTTGFLDGKMWFWWDRIRYVFEKTQRRSLRVPVGGQTCEYAWTHDGERNAAVDSLVNRCKTIPDTEKLRVMDDLAAQADLTMPSAPPPEYRPMTWDDVRRCERRGMSFGPHTVTHPILARTHDRQAETEITESWRRLREEAASPVPVFCYPNGKPGDYGLREYQILAKAGLIGAVVGRPGYVESREHLTTGTTDTRFQIPRFSWPEDVPTVAQYVSGLERLKGLLLGRS